MKTRINVIDPDVRRRARVSRELRIGEVHVEIYENVDEFAESSVATGLIFIVDEDDGTFADKIDEIRDRTQAVLPIVGYAEAPAPQDIVAAMRAGALDYLVWPFDSRLLKRALRRVANDDDGMLRKELQRIQAEAKVRHLSAREAQVLMHLVRGCSNKEIGLRLGISPRTVEIHRGNMMGKLGAHSLGGAIRIGVHAGLDDAPERIELRAVA